MKTQAGQLAELSSELLKSSAARKARDAFSFLSSEFEKEEEGKSAFVSLFGPSSDKYLDASEFSLGRKEALTILKRLGILRQEGQHIFSNFVVARFPGDFFYITDKPTGAENEVFCPHFEQRALVDRLLARPSDQVLDLCTGSGILLIEAIRRGAHGVGIDSNTRALTFARVNALINGVEQHAEFLEGDVTDAAELVKWGQPNLVISNPPFEPAPPGVKLPWHSQSGIDGTGFITPFLEVIGNWKHKPEIIQLVLFSLRNERRSSQFMTPSEVLSPESEDLSRSAIGNLFQNLARHSPWQVEIKELAPPLGLRDICAIQYSNGGPTLANTWAEQLVANNSWADGASRADDISLQLVLATLYSTHKSKRAAKPVYQSYSRRREGEECFVLPLGTSGNSSVAKVFQNYSRHLTTFREEKYKSEAIDLRLDNALAREFLASMLRSDALFGDDEELIVLDVRKDERIRALVSYNISDFKIVDSLDELRRYIPWRKASAAVCDVLFNPPYLRNGIISGALNEVLKTVLDPKIEVQRFAAIGQWPNSRLSPTRQLLLGDLLSELCFQSEFVKRDELGIINAETLKTRTLQERAWAHDIKHWTNPILPDLFFALSHIPKSSDAYDRVKRARLHTLILNATANARQTSIAHQATRLGEPSKTATKRYGFSFSREHISEVIGLVTEVLLITHAENPENAQQFELQWQKARPLESVLTRLAEIVFEGRKPADLYSVLTQAPVLWPMAFLREIVHNIRINNIVQINEARFRQIDIAFRSEIADDTVCLHIIQKNYESGRRLSETLPEGLVMANTLYGPNGAGLGWIDDPPVIKQQPVSIARTDGTTEELFHIEYSLSVSFNLPEGSTNARC